GEGRVKVVCLQENLSHGLGIAGRGVSTRGSLPILGNVLLRTDAGRLRLTATNLEVGINCWVPAKVEDEGAITVPAKLFIDFVNSLPPGNVELSLNVRTKTVHIKAGPYEANIKGLDAEEFPIIPQIPDKPTTRMAQGTLRRMISEVAFVAATDDSRPVLTGVLTTFAGEMITMAAADPYRLSVRHARLLDRVDPPIEVIVPAKSLFEVARIVGDSDDATVDILVTPNKSQVIFHTDEADLVSRIIEGQFPNYRQVIPTTSNTKIVAQREELLKARRPARAGCGPHCRRRQLSSRGDAAPHPGLISRARRVAFPRGLPQLRTRGLPVRSGRHRVRRPERRGQDQPARGRAPRGARRVIACRRRRRDGPLGCIFRPSRCRGVPREGRACPSGGHAVRP